MKRRSALQKILVGIGLLATGKEVSAATKAKPHANSNLEGEWRAEDGRLCAIFKQGRVLLVVNPLGSIGVAHLTKTQDMLVVGGVGWDVGLIGKLSKDGNKIEWSNSTAWLRE